MKYIQLFMILFFAIQCSFGQLIEQDIRCDTNSDNESGNCYGYIIALSGLRLRESPALDAKVITTIPLGAKVIRKKLIAQMTRMYDYPPAEWTKDSIPGNWELLEWNGISGYGFNAFIGNPPHPFDGDYYLMFEDNSGCSDDSYASLNYYYYGLFINKDTTVSELRSFKPTFYTIHDDFSGTSIRVDDKQKTEFVMISKKPMSEGAIKTYKNFKPVYTKWEKNQYLETPILNKVRIPASNWVLESKKGYEALYKDDTTKYECIVLILFDLQTGTSQRIGAYQPPEDIVITWCGDLDHDGKNDFIIKISSEESIGNLLFLSSNPGKGKLVRFACEYYWFDCC